MCDYSLQLVVSRPAMVGDELVSTKFTNAITGGFAAVGEVEYEHGFFPSLKRAKKVGERVARFRQVNTDEPHLHHDALEFPDGQIVLVTRLCEGQHAMVLQLPAAPRTRDAQDQQRVAIVA